MVCLNFSSGFSFIMFEESVALGSFRPRSSKSTRDTFIIRSPSLCLRFKCLPATFLQKPTFFTRRPHNKHVDVIKIASFLYYVKSFKRKANSGRDYGSFDSFMDNDQIMVKMYGEHVL